MEAEIYVQYGCGFCAPESWVNFDASPTLRFERLPILGKLYTKNAQRFPDNVRYGDIVKGLPVGHAACRGIYCSHVLEHLALEDFHRALDHTFAYLKPGGIFRLVVPDLDQLVREYVAKGDALRFVRDSGMGRESRNAGLRRVLESFGNSQHLWMWDERAMREALADHGFTDIRRAQYGDSQDARFLEVEQADRFANCLAMQCVRPIA